MPRFAAAPLDSRRVLSRLLLGGSKHSAGIGFNNRWVRNPRKVSLWSATEGRKCKSQACNVLSDVKVGTAAYYHEEQVQAVNNPSANRF